MTYRQLRAYLALALYAVAYTVAVTSDSIARNAETSGIPYNGTIDRVIVVASVIVASALIAWNIGQAVYHNRR